MHFFGLLKKKSIYTKYFCLLSQKFFPPDLPKLSAQIRCAQNWFTAVQVDLKYPMLFSYFCHLSSTNYFELSLSFLIKISSNEDGIIYIKKYAELLTENNICIIACVL